MARFFAILCFSLLLASAQGADPFLGIKEAFKPLTGLNQPGGSGIEADIDVFDPGNLPTGAADYKKKRKDYWGVFIQIKPSDNIPDTFEFRKKWYGSEGDVKGMSDDLLKNKIVLLQWENNVYRLDIRECPNTKRDHYWVKCSFTYKRIGTTSGGIFQY